MKKETGSHTLQFVFSYGGAIAKWTGISVFLGVIIGGIATLFCHALSFATRTFSAHHTLLFLLPFGGLVIVFCYRILKMEKDLGTNQVLVSIQSQEPLSVKMAPLIFLSTVITHLFGGSAGREGAALQLGGSLGAFFGRLFRLDSADQHIFILCGMSAAFSALFGTPLAAAVFAIEVVHVGIMYYAALLPCALSALIAGGIAGYFGVAKETFVISLIPDFGIFSAVEIALLAVLCAFLGIGFCFTMEKVRALYGRFLKNPYLRVFTGGLLIVLLTLLVGSYDYNGSGMSVIAACFEGEFVSYAFLLKILFTALTLGAGYKGGEIVPSLFIGATFGCLFGSLIDLSPTLCCAVAMGALFCSVTNCPMASLFICFELFGFEAMPYFLIAIAVSYLFSGYFGLYKGQLFFGSKIKDEIIHRNTR